MKKTTIISLTLFLLAAPFLAWAISVPNPLTSVNSPEDLMANVIKLIMGLTGSIALLLFVYGGFMWMTSAGNSERIQKGKNIFIWATVGLAVIFGSYAILRTIFEVFK